MKRYKNKDKQLNIKNNIFPKKTVISSTTYIVTPLIYVILKSASKSVLNIINWYINHGADLNEVDDQGRHALIYAITENSKKVAKFLLSQKTNSPQRLSDHNGKTLLHYVVCPLEYGSYENIDMLKLIYQHFKELINTPDKHGRTPMFYAKRQDSGRMADALKLLGAEDVRGG